MAGVKPIPDEYPRVIPYLTVKGASEAIDFYTAVLGAKERMRMPGPNGMIGHAELNIGDSVVMLADADPMTGGKTPKDLGDTPVTLMVYVEDVDAVFKKALDKGARAEREVEDQFYGDRSGLFVDPFGHKWFVATHIEDVSEEEMQKRVAKVMASAN